MTDGQQVQYMSQDKLNKLKQEYNDLKQNKIPTIAKRIDDARQMGDLSENAEYQAARDEMAWAQSRLKELAFIFDNAEVIEHTHGGVVSIGSTIMVKSQKLKKTYTIVGPQEADPLTGKISNESPLGSAFLGKHKGDRVRIELPAGIQDYEIIEVA